ncbi:MAG: phenylalanine--tRNA ligase subunit beta [Epsilonproteobacteria bacterium]|nr:phenylalanine--tRNA ligase subunit beta [Campylobacterota bacterium]NPA56147.1 phenylalanine--tRNA ligase subunit beta [Campylobacterota bacterium]
MIVTRSWLQEWIDIRDISTKSLIATLNRIGLEVAQLYRLALPGGVVVGRVISCQKHPDADRLTVCEVEIGEGKRLQIVCGARNAKYARYVAVATVGTKLPNGMEIEPTTIRGVESYGMLCSATELGLPKIEDGIMLLDESIGEIEVGKELNELPIFRDEVIDIELTPNRGDCLSVLGIARELAGVLKRKIKSVDLEESNALQIGIGRLLNLKVARDVEANLIYKAFSAKNFTNPFLIRFRLALVGEQFDNRADEFGYYITHSTGVITRVYGYHFFDSETPAIVVKKDENSFDAVYGRDKGSIIGVIQYDQSKPDREEERFIIEASYIEPEKIAKQIYEKKIETDWEFYRSSRGSEPRLEIALRYFKYLLRRYYTEFMVYAGTHEVVKEIEQKAIKIDFDELDTLIGQTIERSTIVDILKSLEFEILSVTEDSMVVKVPVFRHDIDNLQDVAEEIVRLYGIDNIASKPLCFFEKNRLNRDSEAFGKRRLIRELAVGSGYFETVSFIFSSSKKLERYGLPRVAEELDLVNPITSELDTLRTSLVPNLLDQVVTNIKNGRRRVKLFEVGKVFDRERREREMVAFVFSGEREPEGVFNQGKPQSVEFNDIFKDMASILGDFTLKSVEEPPNGLMHPYQRGEMVRGGERIGWIYKLTLPLQEELELPPTYLAEVELEKIDIDYPKAKPFSIYQLSFRDLSLLVDREISFQEIREALGDLPEEVRRFYPIDLYEDEQLGGKKSITIRFAIQSDKKTLTEEEIGTIMEGILERAKERVGAELR